MFKTRNCHHREFERCNDCRRDLRLALPSLSPRVQDSRSQGPTRTILSGWSCAATLMGMLILASASPRRRDLLSQAGLKFTAVPANLNEDVLPDEAAAAYVQRLAEEKAQAVWNAHRSSDAADDPLVVLGADTCVVVDGRILGKPVDTADVRRMLTLLSGRTHVVMTGLAVVTRDKVARDVEITQVTFDQLSD